MQLCHQKFYAQLILTWTSRLFQCHVWSALPLHKPLSLCPDWSALLANCMKFLSGKRHSLGVTTWSKMCKTPFVVGTSCLGTFEATNSAAQHHPFLGLKCFLRLNGFFCMHCKQSSTKLTKLSLLPLRSLSSSALAVWNWTCKSLQNSKLDQKNTMMHHVMGHVTSQQCRPSWTLATASLKVNGFKEPTVTASPWRDTILVRATMSLRLAGNANRIEICIWGLC